ncbi:MAG: Uma2 family endonuclease [Cyclobacteriaceae bacterium]|nr:Uma2 family endonuclease [Cyclobacteriaceae bacterium]
MEPIVLKFPSNQQFTDDELFDFCAANDWFKIERNKQGQLIIMSPSGSLTSNLLMRINRELLNWLDKQNDLGYLFESSAGFKLPDGSVFSADAAFVMKQRWESLTKSQQEKFAPVCPDFVIEVRSPSDSIQQLKEKMNSWMANGCRLGWLIDPIAKKAWIYTQSGVVKTFENFEGQLDGLDVLPELNLNLKLLV